MNTEHTPASAGALVRREAHLSRSPLTFDAKARTVSVVCSTDAIDSYGESVEQKWDLARYRANPIVLYAHNARELPIGISEGIEVRKLADGRQALVATVRFASAEANPVADQVLNLFAEGVLRGVSVGFIPRSVRTEKRAGRDVTILTDNELHELSVTPVPANPEALVRGARTGDDRRPLDQATRLRLAELLQRLGWLEFSAIVAMDSQQSAELVIAGKALLPEARHHIEQSIRDYDNRASSETKSGVDALVMRIERRYASEVARTMTVEDIVAEVNARDVGLPSGGDDLVAEINRRTRESIEYPLLSDEDQVAIARRRVLEWIG